MHALTDLFLLPGYAGSPLQGHYFLPLVGLSLLIAILSSCTALHMLRRAEREPERWVRRLALSTAAFVLGGGVWSMHFIGMLSLDLCATGTYVPWLTLLSMIPGVLAAGVAMRLLSNRHAGGRDLLVSGALMGGGIGCMHYSGMAALEMPLQIKYDLVYFLLSLVVAVILAILALWIHFGAESRLARLRAWQRTLLAGSVMGLAISGMHYLGMGATRFLGDNAEGLRTPPSGTSFLAVSIFAAIVVLGILVVGFNLMLSLRSLAQRLAMEREHLRTMMDTVVDAIVTIDSRGHILDFNVAATLLFGWQKSEVAGRNVSMLMAEPFRSRHDGYLFNYLRTGVAKIIGSGREVLAVHRDGSQFPIRLALGHARRSGEDLFVGCITDLRQQKEHLLALERAQAIIETCHDAIISKSLDGVITSWNSGATSLFGFSTDEAVGQSMRITIPPQYYAEEDQFLVRVSAGDSIDSLETVRQRKDGSRVDISVTLSPVRDQQGRIVGISHIARDISAQKLNAQLRRDKEKAEQAAKARTDLMVSMSHEVRTPLNQILGFSEVILSGTADSTLRQQASDIREASRSLMHILGNMLDSVDLDQGRLEVSEAPFRLADLLDALQERYQPVADERQLGWQIDAAQAAGLTCVGDEEKVLRILENLLDNAFKFTKAGTVTLGVQARDQQLCFEVRDTGIGMNAQQLAKVFRPLTQGDSSMAREYAGIGLGCTLSQQLALLLGGSVQVQSTLGSGTCFVVTLPARQVQEQASRSLRILAVDDVALNLKLLQAFLGKQHSLEIATGGQAAIDLATRQHFDLVLMDVQMPVVDGLQATRSIRENEARLHKPRVPIIAITANTSEHDRQAALDAGMDAFVGKPISKQVLMRCIQQVLAG